MVDVRPRETFYAERERLSNEFSNRARDIYSSMALITMREVWKRVMLSTITLPFTAAGSYIIKNTLDAWGILDDFSVVLGNWLKINVTPTISWSTNVILWTVSSVFMISLYCVALFLIWRRPIQNTKVISSSAFASPSSSQTAGMPTEYNKAVRNRIPIVQLRQLAEAAGWNVDRRTSNDGYNLTNKLNQAAADGALQFWGRKYEYDFGEDGAESVPLVRISQKHFLDYRFESTNLFGDASNFYIFTGQPSKQPRQLRGLIYQDIHIDRNQIEAWLPAR